MNRFYRWVTAPVAVPRWQHAAFLFLITLGAVATLLELLADALT